ncbi:MAG: hypothetical protein ABW146_19570, partial [Candidatus Sedimenticola sp. 6PFRAG7]
SIRMKHSSSNNVVVSISGAVLPNFQLYCGKIRRTPIEVINPDILTEFMETKQQFGQTSALLAIDYKNYFGE